MKKTLILLLVLISFSGCLAGQDKETDTNSSSNETTSQDSNENDGETVSDQVLDNKLMENALETQRNQDCAKIKNDTQKAECEKIVTAFKQAEEAAEKGDANLCKKISLERYKVYCEELVQDAIAAQQEEVDSEKLLETKLSTTDKAIAAKDPGMCKQIESDNYQQECLYTVLMSEEYGATSSSVCNQISKPVFKDLCLSDARWDKE